MERAAEGAAIAADQVRKRRKRKVVCKGGDELGGFPCLPPASSTVRWEWAHPSVGEECSWAIIGRVFRLRTKANWANQFELIFSAQ